MTQSPIETEGEGRDERLGALDEAQGGGPPAALPWTMVVEGDDGWEADLEHGAALPRVDDFIEFIDADGSRELFRVTRVVHTVQPSARNRPHVHEERVGPNSTVEGPLDGGIRELRAGLPRVFVRRES